MKNVLVVGCFLLVVILVGGFGLVRLKVKPQAIDFVNKCFNLDRETWSSPK